MLPSQADLTICSQAAPSRLICDAGIVELTTMTEKTFSSSPSLRSDRTDTSADSPQIEVHTRPDALPDNRAPVPESAPVPTKGPRQKLRWTLALWLLLPALIALIWLVTSRASAHPGPSASMFWTQFFLVLAAILMGVRRGGVALAGC